MKTKTWLSQNGYKWNEWVLENYCYNYDFCEYVKVGAILWKELYFVNNCEYLQHITFLFLHNRFPVIYTFPNLTCFYLFIYFFIIIIFL